ncbi:MAG: outer membrane lipoprotein carrier protein LolA [Bacteroidales bacterium]
MKNILITVFVMLYACSGFSQDIESIEKGDKKSIELLDRLTLKTEAHKTIQVEFTYKMINEEANINESTAGKLLVMGNKYRLNIAGQDVISDGETSWTYIEDAGEVQINTVEDSEEAITPNKLLSSYNESFRSKFIKEGFQYGTPVNVIDLTPVEGKSYYKVRLVIDKEKDQLLEITIFDKNGSTYSYIINKFLPNVDVNPDIFSFKASDFPDADVIDMR